MSNGFDHFDGNGKENFAAALILLCIEEDPAFRDVIARLIGDGTGLSRDAPLVAWGREESLDPNPELKRRSDLWLRFPTGIILIEVKTHSGWDPSEVARQLADQRKSKFQDKRVLEAVLLAPGQLLRRLPSTGFPRVSWQTLIEAVSRIKSPARILELAWEHWSNTVERDFGIPSGSPSVRFSDLASQTGCLVAFLKAAILRVGGATRGDTVWFSSADGGPEKKAGWAWHSIGIPGQLPGVGAVYCGILTYTEAPPNEPRGTFLELYPQGKGVPLASVQFNPQDYSSTSLNTILDDFAAAYKSSHGNIP